MTRKQLILLTVGSLLIAGSLVGGIAYWRSLSQDSDTESDSPSRATNSTDSIPITTNSGAQGSSIPIGGGSSPQASTIPSPAANPNQPDSDFREYDQFAGDSNVRYRDAVVGTGAVVAVGKTITANYRGWLTSGKLFDESYSGGKPFSFVLGNHGVIVGWEAGIDGMRVGGKRRLVIPPSLAYGDTARGSIPAHSVLVFDIELVGVQ